VQRALASDAAWVADVACFRLLMEWTNSKERFGNTPENEIRPDLSKLSPDGFHFQAMMLKHQGRLRRPFRSGDCIDVWSISRRYLVLLYAARITPSASKQRLQPSWTNNIPKSGPARFAGRRLRSNPKKPGDGR
jgi:hypothetical protein